MEHKLTVTAVTFTNIKDNSLLHTALIGEHGFQEANNNIIKHLAKEHGLGVDDIQNKVVATKDFTVSVQTTVKNV